MGHVVGFVFRAWFCGRLSCLGGSQFFERSVESTFGSGACGGDTMEGFVFREQRVDAFGGGEFGFDAVRSQNVPRGEDNLGEVGELDRGAGAEFIFIGVGERLEFQVVFGREEHGLPGVEAELRGVGR